MRGSSRPHARVASIAALAWMAIPTFGCSEGPTNDRCEYPEAAEYGYEVGDIVPPTLSWVGTTESGEVATISIKDYQDCDGTRGINALLVDQSTAWCGPCQRLAAKVGANLRSEWRGQGIHVLTLLTQAADASPATPETAIAWKRRFGLEGTAVAADPQRSLRGTAGEQAAPYPYHMVVDPRTMRIISVEAGFDGRGEFPALRRVSRINAGD